MTLDKAVFGHAAPTTLLSRSETYIGGDCYIVSGSRDSTLLLWYWNGRRRKIVGDSLNPLDNPSPRATLGKFLEKKKSKAKIRKQNFITKFQKKNPKQKISKLQKVGHSTEVVSASVCAELGMIASSAKQGPVLIHTITGELLRRLAPPSESLRK